MSRARIMFPRYQDQEPNTEAPVFTPSPGRHPGWRQRRRPRSAGWLLAGRQHEGSRRRDAPLDAQHARVQAPASEGCQYFIARTSPALRLLIYSTLA
jgi:hypothetical protein